MNDIITIKLTFDEKTERDNQKFLFCHNWKKQTKGWKGLLIITVVFLFLGFYPIKYAYGNSTFYFFRIIGVFVLVYLALSILRYFKLKKNFNLKLEELICDLKKADKDSFLMIICDHSIEVKNPFTSIDSVWEKTNYQIINNYLILRFLDNSVQYIFNKSEFENADHEVLISHLQKHSRRQD